jgi:hypothetical protein
LLEVSEVLEVELLLPLLELSVEELLELSVDELLEQDVKNTTKIMVAIEVELIFVICV